jgi:hypothetical protein
MNLQEEFKKETKEVAYDLFYLKYNEYYVEWLETKIEQLMLGGVGNSSDLIVVELSDDEIKIISEQELKEWQQSAIKFDGFEGWIVRGRLVKNR